MSDRLAEGDLLTVAQALRLLPVGRSSIYRLIETGQLPCYRVSATGSRRGRVLLAKQDVEAFIAGARQTRPRAPVRVDVDGLLRKVRHGCQERR